jgi:curved DNA-binding protein CbpA
MNDAFEVMGISPGLELTGDRLHEAFREAGKRVHPDAGGGEDEFAKLREAFDLLSSPSRRLKLWLELRGSVVDTRGEVDPRIMDLFGEVGEATQRAQLVVRKRDQAKSALGLAMLESETHLCREAVEQALRKVEAAISASSAVFPEFERAGEPDRDAAATAVRTLAFLERWQAGLRGVYARLV